VGACRRNGPLSNRKTRLCMKFKQMGTCPYGDKCNFAHGNHELKPHSGGGDYQFQAQRSSYKTRMCVNWQNSMACRYGQQCNFAHGPDDLRTHGKGYGGRGDVNGGMAFRRGMPPGPYPMMSPPMFAQVFPGMGGDMPFPGSMVGPGMPFMPGMPGMEPFKSPMDYQAAMEQFPQGMDPYGAPSGFKMQMGMPPFPQQAAARPCALCRSPLVPTLRAADACCARWHRLWGG
jgi:hypothetical protein